MTVGIPEGAFGPFGTVAGRPLAARSRILRRSADARTPPGGSPLMKPGPLFLLLTALSPVSGLAQSSPFLPDDVWRALGNEMSGDRSFEHVRHLTHYHRTGPGRDFWAAADYIKEAAKDAGLEDVRLIRQEWDGRPWTCHSGEAWLLGPEPEKLADFGAVAVSIADHSRKTHVKAELVDVGAGTSADDYEGIDVEGRVVLASASPSQVMRGGRLEAGSARGRLLHVRPLGALRRAGPGRVGAHPVRSDRCGRGRGRNARDIRNHGLSPARALDPGAAG